MHVPEPVRLAISRATSTAASVFSHVSPVLHQRHPSACGSNPTAVAAPPASHAASCQPQCASAAHHSGPCPSGVSRAARHFRLPLTGSLEFDAALRVLGSKQVWSVTFLLPQRNPPFCTAAVSGPSSHLTWCPFATASPYLVCAVLCSCRNSSSVLVHSLRRNSLSNTTTTLLAGARAGCCVKAAAQSLHTGWSACRVTRSSTRGRQHCSLGSCCQNGQSSSPPVPKAHSAMTMLFCRVHQQVDLQHPHMSIVA